MIKRQSTTIILGLSTLISPTLCQAAAGFADRWSDHDKWIFPAYMYCLAFTISTLILLFIPILIWKSYFVRLFERMSNFLSNKIWIGIMVAGTIWIFFNNLIWLLLVELFSFMALLPLIVFLLCYPFILSSTKALKKFYLKPNVLKCSILICVSAIIASLLFFTLSKEGLLPYLNGTYLAPGSWWHFQHGFYYPQHPNDSLIDIWLGGLFCIPITIIGFILFGLKSLFKYISTS